MSADLFIDGIIFGEKVFGGIARMWKEIIPRLQTKPITTTLLMPAGSDSSHYAKTRWSHIHIVNDYFYWPKRIFDKVDVRSALLTQLYKASRAKIFHSTYFTTINAPETRKIVTVYDMIYEIFESQNPSKWVKQVLYNKRKSIEAADQIVCISESTKRDLLKFYPSLSEKKIAIIYLGPTTLNQQTKLPSISDIANARGIQIANQNYFLMVGKLDGYKNAKLIFDLLNQNHKARNFKFLCVGGGRTSKIREIAVRNYPENFVFLDFVKDEELAILYRNAIGLIYPSLYEGFGLPIIEAMANSCPVACSFSSSLPEAGGEAAFYFDPLSTTELLQCMINMMNCDRDLIIGRGMVQAGKFSWEKTADLLGSLYEKAL